MSYYLIRIGEGSKFAKEALKDGFIAIGWNDVPDLKALKSMEEIKEALQKHHEYTPYQLGQSAGMIERFGFKMKPGDTVLMPKGGGTFAVGTVGDYYREENPKGECHFLHRRKVAWSNKNIQRAEMSRKLFNSSGSIMTLFSLDQHAYELASLIDKTASPQREKAKEVRESIMEKIAQFDPREFETFIGHVLKVIGLDTTVTPYTNDRGIDVVGTIDVEGIADISVCVQVKHTKSVGRPVIQQLLGAARDAHPCVITSGIFTQEAIEEADEIGVKLVDGLALAVLILEHYEELDENYKKIFGLRKKKVPIEDQFEFSEKS